MFILAEMCDVVRIEPRRFAQDTDQEITDELNKKFANKVVHKVGLCISLFDVIHVGDSYIFPGDGASHTKVRFRFIVFRPFVDEILVGKIRSCSTEGVRVSLGFFDDILIPHHSLQHPKRFDQEEQLWVWEYETEDGKHDMFMDIEEEIRFRVVEETFVDTSPISVQPSAKPADTVASPGVATTSTPSHQAPYTITVREAPTNTHIMIVSF